MKKSKWSNQKFYFLLIVLGTFLMVIGYASVNSVALNVNGDIVANLSEKVFITSAEVVYDNENVNDDSSIATINLCDGTFLNSTLSLPNDNGNAYITYKITVYNNTDMDYTFDGVEFSIGQTTYDNENIVFDELDGLAIGDTLLSKDSITFTITFHYKDYTIPDDNDLNSLLNFNFIIEPIVVATFEYSGEYETFVAPQSGMYQIELWGAQGGPSSSNSINPGGLGGYTSGEIYLSKDSNLYVYIGDYGYKPDNLTKPFNGGGAPDITGKASYSHSGSYSGGGATDVRLVAGEWDSFDSLKSRIMVAAGGAGGNNGDGISGGPGGGLEGLCYSDLTLVSIPTQNQGFSFGSGQESGVYPNTYVGSNGTIYAVGADTGAGGGGYYGGYRGYNHDSGGSGGSSYISGHDGCDAISETSTEDNIIHTSQSIHYSGYKFENTLMIDGDGYKWTTEQGSYTGMPSHDGTSTIVGNSGDGYAKISFIG